MSSEESKSLLKRTAVDLRQEAVVVLRPGAQSEVEFPARRQAMLQRTQLQELLEGFGEADARGASAL